MLLRRVVLLSSALLAKCVTQAFASPLQAGDLYLPKASPEQARGLPTHHTAPELNDPPSRLTTLTHHVSNEPLATRGEHGISIINCKVLQRHQQYAIVPTLRAIATMRNFWQILQIRTIYDSFFSNPKELFTITEGRLQVTFSCLGQAVPWEFIHDFAVNAGNAVAMGWLDTFDAIYEQDITGITVWVSLRVLPALGMNGNRPGT